MEYQILSTLSFDLTFPTVHRFLERFIKTLQDDSTVMLYATFLTELALIDIRMLQYPPSIIAASALCLAYNTKLKYPLCSQESERKAESFLTTQFGFKESDLLLCMRELQFLHTGSMKSSLQAVRKKYSQGKYVCIHQIINLV